MREVAVVESCRGPIAGVKRPSWKQLWSTLSEPKIGNKDGLAIVPAMIEQGPRMSARVSYVTYLVLDIEDKGEGQPPNFEKMAAKLDHAGVSVILHTTYGSTTDNPRYRLIIQPNRVINLKELRICLERAAEHFGLGYCWDRACSDPARLFYLPRCPAERQHEFFAKTVEGEPLDIDGLLMRPPPVVNKGNTSFSNDLLQRLTGQANLNEAKDALGFVSADCSYDRWRNIIWALMSTDHPDAISVAEEWSKTAPGRFDAQSFEAVVESYKSGSGLTLGTLFHHAMENGWGKSNSEPACLSEEPMLSVTHEVPELSAQTTTTLRVLSRAELGALPTIQWRIKNVLPATGIAAIYGAPGSSKTFLSLDMAMSLSEGKSEWFGYKCKRSTVLYAALEGRSGIKKRVSAWERHNKAHANNIQFLLDSFNLRDSSDVQALTQAVINLENIPDVVFIDTLNQAAPGADENSSVDMSQLLGASKIISERIGGLVVLVHHSGKDKQKGLRGHSSMNAAMDAVIQVEKKMECREWSIQKSKDGDDSLSGYYDLEVYTTDIDADGDPETSCAVMPLTMPSFMKPPPTGKNQKLVFAAVKSALVSKSPMHFDEGYAAAKDCLPDVDKRQRSSRAKVALEGLISGGHLIQNDEGISLPGSTVITPNIDP